MDLDTLDVSKENIQPLRRGRNVSVLGTALMAQSDVDIHQQLIKERDNYEVLIRSYEGDDPLQHWYNYVLWVEQHFPKQGKEGNLQTLLEHCLQKFKDSEEYFQDVRYIDLWMRYMHFVKNPLSLYNQIYSHGIGTNCAFFYICWAEEFESANDPKRADQIYLKGLEKMAQPIEELERAHIDFQLRIARHVLSNGSQEQKETSREKRSTLSTLRAHGRKKNLVSSARTGSTILHPTPGILPHLSGKAAVKGNDKNYAGSSKIQIYSDENIPPKVDPVVEAIIKDPVSITKENDKENTRNPGRWTEGKVKTREKSHRTEIVSVASSARFAAFHVHEDECCDTPKVRQSDIGVSNVLKVRKMVYEDEINIPVAIFEAPDETKKAMYPKQKVYSGGTEFSLEELRAIRYFNRIAKSDKMGKRHPNTVSRKELLNLCESKQQDIKNVIPLSALGEVENISSSIEPGSKFPAGYRDAERACGEMTAGSHKKQAFSYKKQSISVCVDSEDDVNTLLKSKLKTSHPEIKEKLRSDGESPTKCGSKYPKLSVGCADLEKTSCKKLSFLAYVDDENDADVVESKQKTSFQDEKLCCDNSDSRNDFSRQPNLLEPYMDTDHTSIGTDFMPPKKLSFSVYVDNEDDMNSCLKSKKQTSHPEVETKLCDDGTFELRKEQFKRGLLPSNYLKVPFLPNRQKMVPKPVSGTKAPSEKEHDQSLTVHTREAWNLMRDLFKSPSASGKGPSMAVDSLSTPKPTPMKIFNEASATELADKSLGPSSTTFKVPEIVHKRERQNQKHTKRTATVTGENVSNDVSINVANCYEKNFVSGVSRGEPSHPNRSPERAINIFCDSPGNMPKIPEKPEGIPYIPSPGMTYSQKQLLLGTENKENALGGKILCTSSRRSLAGVLEPSKYLFMPVEEKEETIEESDETGITAAFACPLLFTSTPFLKNQEYFEKKELKDHDDTVTACRRDLSNNNNSSRLDELLVGARTCGAYSDEAAYKTCPSVNIKYLSIIPEEAEEKSRGSSGGSQNLQFVRSPARDSLHQSPSLTDNSVCKGKPFSAFNSQKEKLKKLKKQCLKDFSFPTEKLKPYFQKVDIEFVESSSMTIDGETYLINNRKEQQFKGFKCWEAWKSDSSSLVTLEVHPHTDPWDFYIRKTIHFRLLDQTMKEHFLDATKAVCFSDTLVVVSQFLKRASLDDLMKQCQEHVNSDLSEEDIMFLTCEVVKIVSLMHSCLIVHGNLSWKSFCVRCDNDDVILVMRYFEAALDLTLLNPREENSLFQYDFFDVAKMIYELLFGEPLDNKTDIEKALESSLPNLYQKSIWKEVFHELLKGGKPDLQRIQKVFSGFGCESEFKNFVREVF